MSGFFANLKEKAQVRASEQAFDALLECSLPLFKRALDKGAQPDAWNTRGLTLFHQVAQDCAPPFLVALFQAHPELNIDQSLPDGRTGLWLAVAAGNAQSAIWLLAAGASPNFRGLNGSTPLHQAARQGRTILLRELSSYGADWTIKDMAGNSAMDLLRQYNPARARAFEGLASVR